MGSSPFCTGQNNIDQVPEESAVAGWTALLDCPLFKSWDGKKGLSLSRHGTADLYSTPLAESQNETKGTWSFDPLADRYHITVKGIPALYSLSLSPPNSICILLKGTHSSADLTQSWFSFGPTDLNVYDYAKWSKMEPK